MNILIASAEVMPYAKTGGLGDVIGALPGALRALGHDVRIVMPRYQHVRLRYPMRELLWSFNVDYADQRVFGRLFEMDHHDGTPIYLIDMPLAFERDRIHGHPDDRWRFIVFSRAVTALMFHLNWLGWFTDVVHANDWHTALIPSYVKGEASWLFGHTASVFTIHNLAYQGKTAMDAAWLARLDPGVEAAHFLEGHTFNFMARAIIDADMITTVSPNYALEIQRPEYGEGLDGMLRYRHDRLVGILNGIDTVAFDPATNTSLAQNYDASDPCGKAACKRDLERICGFEPDPQRPLIAMVTRLVDQKGIDLLAAVLPDLLVHTDARLVVLGTGDWYYEGILRGYASHRPDRVAAFIKFDARLAEQIYAGSDMFLMPSRFEPGGLGQLIALRYGSVPIVRATGGLLDTVREGYDGNGFVFWNYDAADMYAAILRACDAFRTPDGWRLLMQRGMREDHSWAPSARAYESVYQRAIAIRRS